MKSFRMIVWLVSALRGLHWRILAILSRSGVKISSDEGHEEVSGGIPWRMARKSSFPCRKETRAVYASSKESFGSGLNDMLRRQRARRR